MRVKTHGQLFDHHCQLKDMSLTGFSPTSLKYHCTECGGILVLKLDREKWEKTFGKKPSFKLTKKVLKTLEELEVEPFTEADDLDEATAEHMDRVLDPDKPTRFVWEPSEEDEEEEEGEHE